MSPAPAASGVPVRYAFSTAADGDLRESVRNRARFAHHLGAPLPWAEVRQVHGCEVVEVSGPGEWGSADALFTRSPGVPLAVFVADCVGVVVAAEGGVGVAHAGWRGAAAGVVSALVAKMEEAGLEPVSAHLSPFIGPCCFEVGREVANQFPAAVALTKTGKLSVDLGRAIAAQLPVPVGGDSACTFHDESLLSHRRLGPKLGVNRVGRMVALAWMDSP
jgi:YfiH family protein